MTAPRVLIVEDDLTILRGLCDNFNFDGYEVHTAIDGRQGLEMAVAISPDVILLDIMLPSLNGFEVCRELRARQVNSTIIILTAKGQEDDIIRGLELGADDYVTKPFRIKEVLARARAFLRRRSHPVGDRIAFGPFELDRSAKRLRRGDTNIELTTKEFGVLEYMATRAGRALTRNELLDAVWGRFVIVSDRSVDRCITTLRSKIEDDPRHPHWIETVRDVGYRFQDDPHF
ncbi:MAG: response regulator transcription factor [Planctomycetales bacterium]|nr:response regulator transcription factor [Planctomycetales bacterium]